MKLKKWLIVLLSGVAFLSFISFSASQQSQTVQARNTYKSKYWWHPKKVYLKKNLKAKLVNGNVIAYTPYVLKTKTVKKGTILKIQGGADGFLICGTHPSGLSKVPNDASYWYFGGKQISHPFRAFGVVPYYEIHDAGAFRDDGKVTHKYVVCYKNDIKELKKQQNKYYMHFSKRLRRKIKHAMTEKQLFKYLHKHHLFN